MKPIYIIVLLCLLSMSVQAKDAHMLITHDIAYGDAARQKLDIYAPRGQKSLKPVHIYIHGGGWMIGDKKHAHRHGQFYAGEGIVFVAINYRLSPDVMHPAHVQDSARAVKWVVDYVHHYGGDPKNIHLSGHSAGAHLAALLGTDPQYLKVHGLDLSMLKTVIPVDTASFDFTHRMDDRPRLVRYMVRQSFGTDMHVLQQASPYQHVKGSKNALRFLSFVTQRRPDAIMQTQRFHNALEAQGVQSEMHAIPRLTHREMNQAMFDSDSSIARHILSAIFE